VLATGEPRRLGWIFKLSFKIAFIVVRLTGHQVHCRSAQRSVPELLLKIGNIDPSVRRRNLCEGIIFLCCALSPG
jgi:hypothetical protein